MDPQPEGTISDLIDPRMALRMGWTTRALCVAVIAACMAGAAGLELGIPREAALALTLGAASVLLRDVPRGLARPAAAACSLATAAIGLHYLWNFAVLARKGAGPGYLPFTGINLVLVGLATLTLDVRAAAHPVSHKLGTVIAVLSALSLIGEIYGTPFRFGIAVYADMHLAVALCCLAMALVALFHHLDHDLAAVLISEGPGGQMSRRLLPFTILMLLALGAIRIQGEKYGLIRLTFGTALFTTITIVIIAAVIWNQSIQLQKTELLRRRSFSEQERLRMEATLRDQFVAMLSHDLRIPITAAALQARLIERYAENPDSCKAASVKLSGSLSRLDRMIQNLLDASRVRAGRPLPIETRTCDLTELARATVADLTLIHGPRFDVRADSPVAGRWDPGALQRLIENLCTNAVKYGAPDSPIEVRVSARDGRAELAVHNRGPAIPPGDQERLFDLFQRARDETGARPRGWGIGLGLVRSIAQAHGGSVHVRSNQAEGTTFTVVLPQGTSESSSAA